MENRNWVEIVEENVRKFGDLVVGIDPSLPDIPRAFARDDGENWITGYVNFVLDTVEGNVGFVKFQSAYFEANGLVGLNALSSGMKRAKAAGMGVILDAKRGTSGRRLQLMRAHI
jgi:orotidine-5'-phosphate decarboxylase